MKQPNSQQQNYLDKLINQALFKPRYQLKKTQLEITQKKLSEMTIVSARTAAWKVRIDSILKIFGIDP